MIKYYLHRGCSGTRLEPTNCTSSPTFCDFFFSAIAIKLLLMTYELRMSVFFLFLALLPKHVDVPLLVPDISPALLVNVVVAVEGFEIKVESSYSLPKL